MKKEVKSQRLQSLDALRGFDMFFIMGGGALFAGLATCCPIPFFSGNSQADGACALAWGCF